MTLPRIGMDMDAHDNHPPPLLTQQHGMVAWLEHMRAEVRCTRFSIVAPPSPLSPAPLFPLCFSPWFLGAHPAPLFFSLPSSPSFLLLVWFSPQSCCSVCHCVIVILTTHSHDVLLPPPLSSFPLPTHQQTALGCEASCTRRAGMLAAPEEDLLTKEHTALPPTPPPFLMSVRTRRCSCRALPEDTTTTAAHLPLACWHRGRSRCQPSRRWAGQQRFFTPPLSSVALQPSKAPFLPPARQRSVMPCKNTTRGWRTGCAC